MYQKQNCNKFEYLLSDIKGIAIDNVVMIGIING